MRGSIIVGVLAAFTLATSVASAHIALISPKPRYDDLKEGPCGRGTLDKRTANVSTFRAGETITVTWQETIGHPSHYRISFDSNGTSAFKDPQSFTDVSGGPAVLLDNIADKSGTQMYSQEITLPDVACDNCTLQLIQVMTDKPPYGDGNDLYYQCADIVLSKDDSAASDAGASSPSASPKADDGGCASSGSRPGSLATFLVAAALATAVARRRKPRL